MKKIALLSVFFASQLVSCGAQTDSESDVLIVGGTAVSSTQNDARLKSTVALTSKEKLAQRSSYCTATLVAPRVVLTAAHCLVDDNRKPLDLGEIVVVFGSQVHSGAVTRKGIRAIAHPQYAPLLALQKNPTSPPNDIGVVILDKAAPSSALVVPIAPLIKLEVAQQLKLAGFGVTKSRNVNDTGVLRQVDVPIVQVQSVARRVVTEAVVKGACAGDSGGPAFLLKAGKLSVVGVTSGGAEVLGYCIGKNNFTDARHYSQWILGIAQQNL